MYNNNLNNMHKELVFATNNQHKIREASQILGAKIKLLSLKEIGCLDDIEENGETIMANASLKSWYVYRLYGRNCFADDTGLEIDALEGRPGVFSARYAGENKSFDDNIQKVLLEMQGITNRNARFRTIISLILHGKEYFFEGEIKGRIIEEKRGNSGFGYDPIFIPDGYEVTFAQMAESEKNRISHRGIALRKMAEFLENETLLD